MGLSVIVTAYLSAETLRQCVERLREDPSVTQILVADCSPIAPDLPIPVQSFPTPTAVPVMRWTLLPQVSEPVVACLEGRCIPQQGWGQALLAAHAAHPEAPGIGGAVEVEVDAGWLDRVVWFCEYAAFAPPLPDAPAPDISGAHLSYKTGALRAEADLLSSGAWETHIHLRWRAAGRPVRTNPVRVDFRNGMTASEFLRQRVQYGRGYAAARGKPWIWGGLTPALPFLLTLRTFSAARRACRVASFFGCLGGIFFFHAMWSCGELLGYWFGDSGKQSNY